MEVWKACELGIDFGIPAAMACAGVWLIWRGFKSRWHWIARRCDKCGYDMRGTEGMKCPGCGRVARSEKELSGSKRNWKKVVAGVVLIFPVFWIAGVLYWTRGPIELFEKIPDVDVNGASQERIVKLGEEQSGSSPVELRLVFNSWEVPQDNLIPLNPIGVWGFTNIRRSWNWFWREKREESESAFDVDDNYGVADTVWDEGKPRYDFKILQDMQGWAVTLEPREGSGCFCVTPDDEGLKRLNYVAHMVLCPVQHYSRYNHRIEEWITLMVAQHARKQSFKRLSEISLVSRNGSVVKEPKPLIEALRDVKGVAGLELTLIDLNDPLVDAIASMRGLERLELNFVKVTDEQLMRLAKNPDIKTLTITGDYKVSADMLIALSNWPALEEVTVSLPQGEWEVSDGAFARFLSAKALEKVNMSARVHLSGTEQTRRALEKKEIVFSSGMVFVFKEKEVTAQIKAMMEKGVMNVSVVGE